MTFPQYRKYANNKSYFKIISPTEFDEIQLIGTKAIKHNIKANQYPEKVLIQDMLNCIENRWIEISEVEFNSLTY